MTVELHGYAFSVYRRIARLALEEKSVPYETLEVDPFSHPVPASYLAMHPFGRVPTLVHDGFVLYETVAITRYVDEAFDGPSLQPGDARVRARMQQVMSLIDSYGYWPMVRQVFSHAVFRPERGLPADDAQVTEGLAAASRVLAALDALATGGQSLLGERISLADIHLGPMMAYFVAAPAGLSLLERYPRLLGWWSHMAVRPAMLATEPG